MRTQIEYDQGWGRSSEVSRWVTGQTATQKTIDPNHLIWIEVRELVGNICLYLPLLLIFRPNSCQTTLHNDLSYSCPASPRAPLHTPPSAPQQEGPLQTNLSFPSHHHHRDVGSLDDLWFKVCLPCKLRRRWIGSRSRQHTVMGHLTHWLICKERAIQNT